MNNYILYLHTTPNGKRYYGITKQKPSQRWKNGKGYPNNKYFTNAIEKYGWDNITHEVLFDGLTEYEAKELEKYMIQWYNTANRDYGYNLSTGGEGSNSGCERTAEWNKKISENRKGKTHSQETKQKIGEAIKGKNNPKAKSVICITTKHIFITTKDAEKYYNVNHSNISVCCQGKRKSAGKYNGQKLVWKYLNHNHNETYRIKKGA